jgi:hypothetical protein
MIDCLIFTKDRACQLDALLKSIDDNFPELGKITIIYKSRDHEFNLGYKRVMDKFPQHNWMEETNLTQNIKDVVGNFTQPFCLTLVDDEIVTRDQSIKKSLSLLAQQPDIHCISLRMGTNVNYTYTANVNSPQPAFSIYAHEDTHLYNWNWKKQNPIADWGYPSCINSHIYRTVFFKNIVLPMNFRNVNVLEGMLNAQRVMFPPHMICFEKPKTINIANNLTQTGQNRHSGKEEFSLESLNNKYLDGHVIDVKPFYNLDINMATFEKDYTFKKE